MAKSRADQVEAAKARAATKEKRIAETFTAHIMKHVHELLKANPDIKNNTGRLYGEAYLWAVLESYAGKQRELIWDQMFTNGAVSPIPIVPKSEHTPMPGRHELGMSPHFVATAQVTQPVKRFKDEELMRLLQESKWQIPAPAAKEMIEKAKVPTKSTVIKRIEERQME